MPTENEELDLLSGDATDNTDNIPLDVTEFVDTTIPEGHVQVTILIRDDYEKTLIVRKEFTEELSTGIVLSQDLSISDMEDLIQEHGVCWVNNNQWFIIEDIDDVRWSELNNEWILTDESVFGFFNRGEEGYWHYDEDYVRCSDTDICYIDGEEAQYHDCHYCESCDEYRSSDHHNFDECGHSDQESWNNQVSISTNKDVRIRNSHNKKYGTDSQTWSISNGIRYTFGVELETASGCIDSSDWNNYNLASVYDGSINGNEYVTGVLRGDNGFNHLRKICKELQYTGHTIDRSCGIHVHIGGRFNRRFTIMLLRLCYHLQDDLYRMMPVSRAQSSYCKPIPTWASEITFQNYRTKLGKYIYGGSDGNVVLDKNHNKKCRHDRYCGTRYRWVNINNFSTDSGKPTVEFRLHSASLSYDKIRNWILICMSLVLFAENKQRDIYSNINSILLDTVIKYSLGDNLGEQIMNYYNTRVEKFSSTTGISDRLPSAIIERDGEIV